MKNRNKPMSVIRISYLANDDLMHPWVTLVYILECVYGEWAIPRYETIMVEPGICMKEVETRASSDVIQKTIDLLMTFKDLWDFPEIIDITVKKES